MKWIVLLRGVNVGGKGKLPMKELRERLLEEKFFQEVETYIQSGNLVLTTTVRKPRLIEEAVQKTIESGFGFAPRVLALSAPEFRQVVEANPYPHALENPKSLHFFFMDTAPDSPGLEKLESLRAESESFQIQGRILYLHAPDGIGRSKLAAAIEKAVGVDTTARNWNTVKSLLEMLD